MNGPTNREHYGKITLSKMERIRDPFRRLVGASLVLAGVLACFPAHGADAKKTYTVAVVPHRLPLVVKKDWSPLLERLAARTGADFQLKVYRGIPRFEAELMKGVPDFAFMNPYHQVMARRAKGYIPLVRRQQPLTGILVVRHDSPVQSAKELDGQTLAFPAPNAFGASLYMRALLTEQVGIRFQPYYVDAHSEVYRHVILGEAAAGGGIHYTFSIEPATVQAQLRVLYRTPETASHCLSAQPRVPRAVRKAVLDTILELNDTEEGRTILNHIQLGSPIMADYGQDYQPLERLGLEKYVVKSD